MIAAFDVRYLEDGRASAAAVLFHACTDAKPAVEYGSLADGVSPYIPGQFYRRELPCILGLLEQFHEAPDEMVVDGYVLLGDRPGLGHYLFESFHGQIPVIGVAKSRYRGAYGAEIFRGGSKRPLYVTSAGVNPRHAAERIGSMHGAHRVPTLLKRVDLLARARGATLKII
jgi:deoxyribonuclease V